MSRNLRNARKALRQAITYLQQSINLDTLSPRTRHLVVLQMAALQAEVSAVTCRLVDAHEYRAELRAKRKP